MTHTRILHHFGITSADFLGKGSESQVYALDHLRVVRIYPPGASLDYIQARQHFYTELAAQRPSFAIPQVLDHGVLNQHPYTIERRMHGDAFAHVLPRLDGPDRERALLSYLDLAGQIGTIQFPDAPYGELILPHAPMQRDTWSQFLWDRAQQTLRISRNDVLQDIPQLDDLLTAFYTRLRHMEPMLAKRLVHGDYFPGNVFIDDTCTVYGVGDFGYSTVVGDPQMDIAGAVIFLEVVDGYQATDTEFLMHHLQTRAEPVGEDTIDLYRLYYSFYFSHCKHDDPKTYAWCIQNLRTFRSTTNFG